MVCIKSFIKKKNFGLLFKTKKTKKFIKIAYPSNLDCEIEDCTLCGTFLIAKDYIEKIKNNLLVIVKIEVIFPSDERKPAFIRNVVH